MNNTNNFFRKLLSFTPTRFRILAILIMLGALSLLASTSFARNFVREIAPRLFSGSTKTVGLEKDAGPPNYNKYNTADPNGRNNVSSLTRGRTAQDVDATFVPVKPVKATKFHGDVRQLPLVKPKLKKVKPEPKEPSAELPKTLEPDAALQPFAPAAPAPTPSASLAGLDFANWGDGWPPDTNGDVGPNHYIETVNTSIGIYDKSTGLRVAAFTFNTFFSQAASGTPCDNSNQGDPVVLYDALSDRWIVSDFAWSNFSSGAMYQCMAVSQTSDPVAGGWYFYAWQTASGGKIPDYPKLGVWPDGIYMSANVFSTTGSQAFQNAQVWAFNRAEMESGVTAHAVSFSLPAKIQGISVFSLLPSNARNNGSAPPAGTPNYFTSIWGTFAARVWKFHVDYAVPANSTLTGPSNVTIPSFSVPPSTVPENGGNNLDSLGYRLMMQNQYQNLSGIESLWISHTVGSAAPNTASVRWYQLNVTSGTVITSGPVQQGTWSPDSKHRFMSSLALDKNGDMAVGYSVSSSTMYPSIRYAGRLASDPLNTLGQGETSLIEGTGFQCCNFSDGTVNNRWGDYSAMTIDPNGCTFWYTNEYYDTQPTTLAADNWKTRIGSFKFTQCTPNAVGILQGTVTAAATGNPISGALVVAGIYSLKTDVNGFYRFANTPVGTYNVNVSAAGYSNGSASNVSVTNGGTTVQNFALTAPAVNTNLAVSAASGTYGGTTTLSATLTQQGGSPLSGKTITFTLNASGFANNTAVTNASGVATLSNVSLSGINAGSYPTGVGASFAGDAGNNASSGSNSLTVNKANQTISFGPLPNKTYGDPDFTVSATASSGLSVSFAASGQCTVTGSTVHLTASGSCTITASQAGDTNYNAAPSVPQTFTIASPSPTPTPTPTPTPGAGAATFINLDTVSQGSWKGVYGADGYNVINDTVNYPAYAQVTAGNQSAHTWLASTNDVRALQKALIADRIASTWYAPSSFDIDVNITDGQTHQVAVYCLDWDTISRVQTIEVRDAVSNALLDSRGVSSFTNGKYLVWNVTNHIKFTVTSTAGANAVVSGLFFQPTSTPVPTSPGAATFINLDTVSQGSWQGVYGAEGYNVINDTVSYPTYAQVTVSNPGSNTWVASTSDVRALQKALIADRIAAAWYAPSSFDIEVNISDGQTHQLAVYCLDWDTTSRAQTIEVLNAGTNALLDSRSVSAFTNGKYLVWNISGRVKFRVTSTAGANAVISGLFFQPTSTPLPTSPGAATFINLDTGNQGTWQGVYGLDGYNIINDTVSYPAYAQVNVVNQNPYTWVASTGDVRALQKALVAGRIAATWYAPSSFEIDVNISDGQTHQVAVYCLDWDTISRGQTIEVLNAASNALLDTRSVSSFTNGKYLVWNISGHVKFRVTRTAGENAVISGLFFR